MGMLLGGTVTFTLLFHNLPYGKAEQEQCLFIVSEEIEAVANKSTLYEGLLYRLVIAQTLKRPELMQVFVMTILCISISMSSSPLSQREGKSQGRQQRQFPFAILPPFVSENSPTRLVLFLVFWICVVLNVQTLFCS